MASSNGHTDIVKLLLERNPNVDLCYNDGFSPLIHSCLSNNTSIVQLLVKHKPDINSQALFGFNALLLSVQNENVEITKLLLENNADCNICIQSKESIADTVNNHPQYTLDKLKQDLFNVFVKNKSSHVTDYVNKKSVDYAFDVVAGSSPLHFACFEGNIDIVSCLLDHNANINMTKEDGTTPLFLHVKIGHEDIVRLLLDKGADTQICRLDGASPLTIATDNGHTSIVMMLKITQRKKKVKLSS
ncbi:ANK [Mytilus edulis]|uniref:ANK n=1 Tax=Mytilus edulis TaxID=6550 RepID=A0A8S3RL19_MYTED|nr:ANK [Mytilus edulis]